MRAASLNKKTKKKAATSRPRPSSARKSVSGSKRSKKASPLVLSLDFGSHALKLVEVERGPLGPVIKTFGVTPYLKTKKGEPNLTATLEELIRASNARAKNVLLTLSPLETYLLDREKPVDLQSDATSTPTANMLQAMQALKNTLSDSLGSNNTIWPLRPSMDLANSLARYSFLTVPKYVLDFYKKIVESNGLDLMGVQYAPHALGRGLAKGGDNGRTGLIEMGAGSSSWHVFDEGHMVQKAYLPYGSDALTNALGLAHGWQGDQAEEHKRSLTGPMTTWPTTSATVVETYLKNWWEDLLGMMAESPAHLDRILMMGGGARFAPLRESVFERFGLLPEDWKLPETAHVSEDLRQYLDPQLPVLVNSLALLVNP